MATEHSLQSDLDLERAGVALAPSSSSPPTEANILADEDAADPEKVEKRRLELELRRANRKKRRKLLFNTHQTTDSDANNVVPPSSTDDTQIIVEERLPSWCLSAVDYRPSALTRAIEHKRWNYLRAFVSADFAPSVINELDRRGRSPLGVALLRCEPEALSLLLRVGPEDRKGLSEDLTAKSDESPKNMMTEDEDEEPEYADIRRVWNDLPLFHLPLSQVGVDAERTHRATLCWAMLLSQRAPNHPVVKEVMMRFMEDENDLSLSEKALGRVNIDVLDYESKSVLDRLTATGAVEAANLFLAAGADPVPAVSVALRTRNHSILSLLLEHEKVKIALKDREWVTLQINECLQSSSWICLFDLVRAAPELTGEEFEFLARSAEENGTSSEFLEVFKHAIDDDSNIQQEEYRPLLMPARTGVYTHQDCLMHLMEPNDFGMHPGSHWRSSIPENPGRLEVLLDPENGALRHSKFNLCQWQPQSSHASLADILRVHDAGYVSALVDKAAWARAIEAQATEPFELRGFDADTPISALSWDAAMAAAGSVISAVQDVCTGRVRNAFCCVRPPGHHLGVFGAAQPSPVDGNVGADVMASDVAIGSQGFCLLNNVAIGAAYARYNFQRNGINRIAIVDFDVHHGNGTEQIIRSLGRRTRRIILNNGISHGGSLSSVLRIPEWRVWRDESDADNLMFASVHGFDGIFYPATGEECHRKRPEILNVPLDKQGIQSYRTAFTDLVLPALLRFKPDLLMVSAGFDGHAYDAIGTGFSKCTEDLFGWMTAQLVAVANSCCEGRLGKYEEVSDKISWLLVSVLEGGYNTALGLASPFARSVAVHLDALNCTSVSRQLRLGPLTEQEDDDDENENEDDEAVEDDLLLGSSAG